MNRCAAHADARTALEGRGIAIVEALDAPQVDDLAGVGVPSIAED